MQLISGTDSQEAECVFDGDVWKWSPETLSVCVATNCVNEATEPGLNSNITKALEFTLDASQPKVLFTNYSYHCPGDDIDEPEPVKDKFTFDLTGRVEIVHYIFATCYYDA